VLLMGGAALVLLAYTQGNIHLLVVMYSINVFLTFTLSQAGMTRFWWPRRGAKGRRRHLAIHGGSLLLCASVLAVTLAEKFGHGGWVTVAITSAMVLACFRLRRHYERSKSGLRQLDEILGAIPTRGEPNREPLDPRAPTAVPLVGSFNGLGVHTLLSTVRFFPPLPAVRRQRGCRRLRLVQGAGGSSAAAEDARRFDTASPGRGLGFAAESRTETGVEIVEPAPVPARDRRTLSKATIISGKLVFRRERWYHGLLTTRPRRRSSAGCSGSAPMVVLPVRASV
jgi:hypothetical protein